MSGYVLTLVCAFCDERSEFYASSVADARDHALNNGWLWWNPVTCPTCNEPVAPPESEGGEHGE